MKVRGFYRMLSGIDNLLGTARLRLIIGLFFIWGFAIILFNNLDPFSKVSLAVAFFALGFTFVFDGQSLLREYFRERNLKL